MYGYICTSPEPVTREQVADAVGVSRKLAAFHLDKLVDAGLLVAGYDRALRAGPFGRAPKVYQRSKVDFAVALPDRRPLDLADLLLEAVQTARPDESARAAALRVADQRGRQLGSETREQQRAGRLGAERALTLAERALSERGFEPSREHSRAVRLRNCPYRPLAEQGPDLVCELNHRFLSGLLAGLGSGHGLVALLVPRGDACCVELRG